ncbi:type II secretion system protein [Vibrio pectenicida]|uniref:Type II secretion system protein n=1 Tax=Vibrio pectenicida TaxID=62763 RepID=A0A7Y4A051_9VIBR|nr:type II secretion system protein [Vibrio pectenicida]NOH72073.1 type II secretion system protein [Vibrio pectenicida]
MPKHQIAKACGFTLVEMIIVITILAIAVGGVSTALFPRGKQSADQIAAVKAAELGRAVIDEVLGRNFDHNSGPNGGLPECILSGVSGAICTAPTALGPETGSGESNNTLYNDVDDFNGFNGSARDVLGNTLSDGYQGYDIAIDVFYEAFNGGVMQGTVSATSTHYKRIEVVVTDRQGNDYPFAAIRGNY